VQFLKAHGWISFGDLLASVAQVSFFFGTNSSLLLLPKVPPFIP